jgi:uncharacterized membrane protein
MRCRPRRPTSRTFPPRYFAWLLLGALSQIAATAFLLAAMKQRNFVIGVAYSKTDALQVAVFATAVPARAAGLGDAAGHGPGHRRRDPAVAAPQARRVARRGGWAGSAALWGLASGAGFAMSAVGYRGAALELPQTTAWVIGAWGVLWAQAIQSVLLGGWLAWRSPQSLRAITGAWRVSIGRRRTWAPWRRSCWFTAFALTTAANVRTLGLVEVVFSYLVSRRLLREKLAPAEAGGLLLVVAGLLAMFASL